MSKSKKSLEKKERFKVVPTRCPICSVETIKAELIEDGRTHDRSMWYFCQCGVIFQPQPPKDKIYDAKYVVDMAERKQAKERYEYLVRMYAPLIEELTYGRMMLDVGYCVPYAMNAMKERGWLTWGIDVNPTLTGQGNFYRGDFLSYDFSLTGAKIKEATGEDKVNRFFDLIWMGSVIEHSEAPLAMLGKAYELLDAKGVLFISTPDIDFIYKTTVQGWPHFKGKEHYIMWSERALCRELERYGFNVILKRRNFSSRFMTWHDLHIIAQKNYF